MKYFYLFILMLLSVSNVNAQIPNSGFENWTDDITPQEWGTNNIPSFWTTVSKSSTARIGSFAAKLEIADFNGGPMFPVLSTTFQVNQSYTSLNGFYQFHPTSNEVILAIVAYFFKNGGLSATGVLDIETASETYSTFNIVMEGSNEIADSVLIQFVLLSEGTTDPGIGSYALIDQLSFSQATDVEITNQVPNEFRLEQNYPNPFNPSTTIKYNIPNVTLSGVEGSRVQLKIFDVLGNEVATLVDAYTPAGSYEVEFNASELTSGIYFYRINAGKSTESKKMMLVK
jgi:hypothetical protein